MPLEYALQYRGMFPDPGPWRFSESFRAELHSPLGINSLPDQRVRRFKLYPRRFNIMVVGESGLGKTTFINTLFNSQLNTTPQDLRLNTGKTVEISSNTFQLCEGDIVLWLNIVDTPGFGNNLNREGDIIPIEEYINKQYDEQMKIESSPELKMDYEDNRIHLVLYFMKPYGERPLKELDVEFLSRIQKKANVLPIISKGDLLNKAEMERFKRNLMKSFADSGLEFYPFRGAETDIAKKYEKVFPFCVIGSEKYAEVGESRVRGRIYPWGVSEVDNEEHCDFVHLRSFLFDFAMQEYVEMTKYIYYADYRCQKIKSERPFSIIGSSMPYEEQVEQTRKNMQMEIKQLEEDVKRSFIERVKERELVLRGREEELIARRKKFVEELDELRAKIDKEKRHLKSAYGIQ